MNDEKENLIKNYSSNGLLNKERSREPKITLKHLNKLKKIEIIRKIEKLRRETLLNIMYGNKSDTTSL